MAKKPPEGSKTDKVNIKDDMDLSEFGDLGDLGGEMNFGDEDAIDDENRKPSRAKVVKDLGKEAASGALDSIIKSAAKKSLPDEYSANYTEAMDIASFASEVVEKNKNELNKSTYKLGKEVKKILPFKVGLLDKYLKAQQSQFEAVKQQSEEELRQAGIGSETAAIFDKQLDVQKSLYARTEAQSEVDRNTSLVQAKLSQEVLANIDGNIAHQTAFMTQISKEYYKRSLELQYKSFYVQADSLKTMREYYKAFSLQFTNIEKNTSLPDFVKLKNTEKLQDILREQSVQSIYGSLTDNNKYLQSVKKKVSDLVSQKVGEVTSAMDGATGMLDMVNSSSDGAGTSAMGMLGGIGATMGGSVIGEKLAKLLPKKFTDKIKDNKTVQKGANMLGTFAASPSSALEALKEGTARKVEENEDESTFGRKAAKKMFSGLNTFLGLATPGAESHEIKNDGYLSHVEPAIFDKNVHRSITEVIPMYLSKILQTNSELTQMYGFTNKGKLKGFVDKPGELVYDFEQRKLGSQQDLNKNIKAKLFSETAIAPKSKTVANNILAQTYIDASRKKGAKDKDLKTLKKTLDAPKHKEMLAKYIELATPEGGQTPDLQTLLDYKDNASLNKLVTTKEELKGLDKLLETLKNNDITDKKIINDRISDITRLFPTEPVKATFLKASEFSGSEPHKIKDDVAQIISRTFISYIQEKNVDVTPKMVLDGSVFKERLIYPNEAVGKQTTDAIMVFMHNLGKIVSLSVGDSMDINYTRMIQQFAFMCKALKDGKDAIPDVFKNINKLSAAAIGPGKLGVDNFRGGSLEIMKPGNFVPTADIQDMVAKNPLAVREARERATTANVLDRLTSSVGGTMGSVKEDIKNNISNPTKLMGLMVDRIKNAAAESSDLLKQKGEDLGKKISEIASNATDFLTEAGIKKLSSDYEVAIVKMDVYITTLKQQLVQVSADIAVAEGALQDVMQEGNQSAKVSKGTKAYKASVENSLRLLEATLVNMKEHKLKIDELKKDIDDDKKGIIFEALKKATTDSIAKMQGALSAYEAAGKTLRI